LFKKLVGEHVACHNIDPMDFDGLLAAYMTPATIDDHHEHLHTHFNVVPEKLQAFRTKRLETESTMQAARLHHRAMAEKAQAQKDDGVKP
jgi:predicted nucleotidyltransferase